MPRNSQACRTIQHTPPIDYSNFRPTPSIIHPSINDLRHLVSPEFILSWSEYPSNKNQKIHYCQENMPACATTYEEDRWNNRTGGGVRRNPPKKQPTSPPRTRSHNYNLQILRQRVPETQECFRRLSPLHQISVTMQINPSECVRLS